MTDTGAAARRVVLVTGAGTGIGRALCGAFADDGALVVANDVDPDAAAATAAALGTSAVAEVADVADVTAVRAMVDRIVADHGRLDVAVANAGVTHFGAFLDTEPADVDRLLAVNVRGGYFTAQAAARAMVARGEGGRILLLSSVTGIQAMRGLSAYGATKAALRQLARTLALELGPHGITVNAIAPGATLTERTRREQPDYEGAWAAVAPTGRVATVEDIAAAARYLASGGAAHVTGQTLVIDGGWTATSQVPDGY
ncbi:MAG: SDR family NAD(P)-dependent oxidoreductase [Actinomycetota bacterium]|nr:SDR family NAD(P)-dependent oxidoreductase [Actinomycetota bacterium]